MSTESLSETEVAVLRVDEEMEEPDTVSVSTRSSLSSDDSNQTNPLELGLVLNALQTTLVPPEDKLSEKCPSDDQTCYSESSPTSGTFAQQVEEDPTQFKKTLETFEIQRTGGHSANLIVIDKFDPKSIKINTLTPREQERADEPVLRAIHHLFNNRFMKAKRIFEQNSTSDPLHALGLGSMVFLKAVMTFNNSAKENALNVLMATYNLASAQIDNATKRNIGETLLEYINTYRNYIKFTRGTGVPTYVTPAKPKHLETHKVSTIDNGVLRAHVVKAECSLQMAIIHLLQENISGYIKCGLNLKRAYASYSIVWQEYKRMGQLHNEYIDCDTISGIQFGIGTVHLVLASLPQKVLRVVAAFGWKADKHLGFALLKLCLEERRARSPMASLMLLAYYTTLTSLCPQILANEYTQPAIETLLDAQRKYPNSAIFLYFAGRTSRLARNLALSTQSFLYAIETSKNEWAEVEVLHMCSYEIGFNHMMQNNWEEASKIFSLLYKEQYWSPAIFRFLSGACLDMMGQRTEAILAFAEVPCLIKANKTTNASTKSIEQYVLRKVILFQSSGYQDLDMSMCALEYLYLFNAYEFMDTAQLEQNLNLIDYALSRILEAEKLEYGIRTRELLPDTPPPEYDDQRGVLLLIKSSILNAMGRFQESIIHLNWIIDRKGKITVDKWIVPYAYWEAGITSWSLDEKPRARLFWEIALGYTNYDFEYRLAMRANVAVTRADEIGIRKIDKSKYPAKEDIKPKDESVELDELQKPENESQEQDMQEIVDELNLGKSASMVH